MKIESIEDLTDVVAGLLNISAEKAKEFMAADDGDEQLSNIGKEVFKKKFDDGHKKATKAAAKTVANTLKLEFGVDVSGDTPEAVVKSFKENHEDFEPGDVTEEAVKQSEAYKTLASELATTKKEQSKIVTKQVAEQLKAKDAEHETKLKEAKQKGLAARLEREAEEWLAETKAILPTDPAKKRKRIQELVKKLAADDIDEDEDDGTLTLSKSDGTPILNAQGHAASVKDRFAEFDYLFDFQQVQGRKSSALPPAPTPGKTGTMQHYKGDVPTDKAGMDKIYMLRATKDITKEAFDEVKAAYEAQQTA